MRQDIRIKSETGKSQTVDPPPLPADTTGGGILLRGVGHAYGELRSLDRIDLKVEAHGVIGLVGPSGCGKSTLLELICGLREQSGGTVEVGGHTAAADRLAIDCVDLMETAPKVTVLLVIDSEGGLTGALHLHDLFRARVV